MDTLPDSVVIRFPGEVIDVLSQVNKWYDNLIHTDTFWRLRKLHNPTILVPYHWYGSAPSLKELAILLDADYEPNNNVAIYAAPNINFKIVDANTLDIKQQYFIILSFITTTLNSDWFYKFEAEEEKFVNDTKWAFEPHSEYGIRARVEPAGHDYHKHPVGKYIYNDGQPITGQISLDQINNVCLIYRLEYVDDYYEDFGLIDECRDDFVPLVKLLFAKINKIYHTL